MKKLVIWIVALCIGTLLGYLDIPHVDSLADFIAAIYTRLFRLLALPTIVLAIISTLSSFGKESGLGKILKKTVVYTFLTTICASVVGALLFLGFDPSPIVVKVEDTPVVSVAEQPGYLSHILNVIPDNIVRPFLEGNILSLLLFAFVIGISIAKMKESDGKSALLHLISGLQELLFKIIGYLIESLPLGIVAFSAQLANELAGGTMVESLGTYVLMIISANTIQFVVVLPMFLVARGLNPFKVFRQMSPAVLMALFTKSSVATLPVTMECAEKRLGVQRKVSRFVLPICTTINMNGCAAFIIVTSLFMMNNSGITLDFSTITLWVIISVISAIGNAGVPMGCYFLTFSLMSGIGIPVGILGVILPIYTIIDMLETAENVWSDSCVCAMVDHDNELKSSGRFHGGALDKNDDNK